MSIWMCSACGAVSPGWALFCKCGQMGAMVESAGNTQRSFGGEPPAVIKDVKTTIVPRIMSGVAEFDRVMGGGIVAGSAILIGGDPGIGKSTILLQIADKFPKTVRTLYVSSEESTSQTRTRAERLKITHPNLYIVSEPGTTKIAEYIDTFKPNIIIIDSIQMVYRSDINSAPGSITQVRESASDLVFLAKKNNAVLFLVGHITKDGSIAGPKTIEHLVDTVLYFEGERFQSHRILRAVKNRFGATNEIGVFDMKDTGLAEVTNTAELFMSNSNSPGTAMTVALIGSRPLIVEIEALAAETKSMPIHRFNGVDSNRVEMILSVLSRVGVKTFDKHIYLNVVGGMTIDEPAGDLAIAMSVWSSIRGIALGRAVFAGEVGLTGAVRAVPDIETRVKEARRLGFSKIVVPACKIEGLDIVTASYLSDIIDKITVDCNTETQSHGE